MKLGESRQQHNTLGAEVSVDASALVLKIFSSIYFFYFQEVLICFKGRLDLVHAMWVDSKHIPKVPGKLLMDLLMPKPGASDCFEWKKENAGHPITCVM